MENEKVLAIEVVYARAGEADTTMLRLEAGTSVFEAITRSGVLSRHPDIDLRDAGIGIFGRLRSLDDAVGDGDRVEIYRSLQADPKQARRQRVRIARRKTR